MVVQAWTVHDVARVLRTPTRSDDKYSRGVVGVRTGSDAYPGAAVLGVEAAWRTGVGMVRYVGSSRPTDLILHRRPETVTTDGRVQAWVIGSGTDAASRPDSETAALRALLDGDIPVVVDAGAIELAVGARAPLVVTPHGREFARLCARLGLGTDEADPARAAAGLGATVLLKGARTLIATPGGTVISVDAGTSWLATAGTGDVLAGIIGALAAARAALAPLDVEDLAEVAASGAWLHGAAARVAAGQNTADEVAEGRLTSGPGHPLVALDVARALPEVIGALLSRV